MDKIPVCAHYELDGQQTDEFPFPVCLQDAKPVIEYVDGWKCDISKVRSWEELPENARNYVEYVEQAIGCHIGYVSVGAGGTASSSADPSNLDRTSRFL